MGKFVFKEYHIKLHGKEYDVLVPSINITEMWAFPMRDLGKCDNWDVIEGNRLAMQWVRNAYITLYQEPNKIIYFSLRDIPPAYELQLWTLPPDLVLYNHQIQFKRKNWKKLKRCMKYMKPKQHVVYFNMPELMKIQPLIFRQWEKNKSYYYEKSWERAYHEYETYFVEGSRKQALELVVKLQESLCQDLEKIIYERSGVEYVGTAEFGRAEYAFVTKEYIDQWKIKVNYYPCILA